LVNLCIIDKIRSISICIITCELAGWGGQDADDDDFAEDGGFF